MIELMKRLVIRTPKGKLVFDSGEIPAHSFTQQFLNLICWIMCDAYAPRPTYHTTVGVAGGMSSSKATWDDTGYPCDIDNDSGDDFGIVCGDSDLAEDDQQWKLQSLIPEGAGAGELNYGITGWDGSITEAGGYIRWSFNRQITNNSGGDIDIKELGVYTRTFTTPMYLMIIRDVLSPYITLPDTNVLTVTYTLRHQV